MKRFWGVVLLCLLVCVLSTTAFAADIVESGTCGADGSNVTWTLDGDGVLTLSGEGAMADYAGTACPPWYSRRDDLRRVIVQEGVTHIGVQAFLGCAGLTRAELSASVADIGEGAFHGCISLNGASRHQEERKATFVFTFDDNLATHYSRVAPKLDEYGFKAGFGILSTVDGTLETQMLELQERGYEILCHSTDGTPFSALTDAEAEAKIQKSSETLRAKGFRIRGFVTPSTWSTASQGPIIERSFDYGFGHLSGAGPSYYHIYHNDSYTNVSYLPQLDRVNLDSPNLSTTIQAKIEECIANKGLMIFYAHSYPSTYLTEEAMTALCTYLKAGEERGILQVLPPSEAIEDYYAPRAAEPFTVWDSTSTNLTLRLGGTVFTAECPHLILKDRTYVFTNGSPTQLRILPPSGNDLSSWASVFRGKTFRCALDIYNTSDFAFRFLDSSYGALAVTGDDCASNQFRPQVHTSYHIEFEWADPQMQMRVTRLGTDAAIPSAPGTPDTPPEDGSRYGVSYAGTEMEWDAVEIGDGNEHLTEAEIGFSSETLFRLGGLVLRDEAGQALQMLPTGTCSATVSVENLAGKDSTTILLACYSEKGQYLGGTITTVTDLPDGGTTTVSLPVDNTAGNIAAIKAFVLWSASYPVPVGAAATWRAAVS